MTKRFRRRLESIIDEILSSRIKTTATQALPVGYNPIEHIRGSLFHWVAVPFNGQDVFCQLRCPNQTQLEQCGDVSNIVIDKEESLKKGEPVTYSDEEKIQIKNYQEELCKLCFNIPTYDHIASLVGQNDFVISDKKAELERINKQYEDNKRDMTEQDKEEFITRIKIIELQLGYILPSDTMAFITSWAMGNDVTDIKKITKDNFLKAASLASIHGKAPTDYISGVFTDFNKAEIDSYAFLVLNEFKEQEKTVKSTQYKWLSFGGKKSPDSIRQKNEGA